MKSATLVQPHFSIRKYCFSSFNISGNATDVSPEGLKFIPAADSPNGKDLLLVANEVSGTTSIFTVEKQ